MVMKSSYLRGLNLASFFVASKITVFMTFMAYVLLGETISASKVFVAVSLYGAVRLTVTLFFPSAVERVSESLISIRRIKVVLLTGGGVDSFSHSTFVLMSLTNAALLWVCSLGFAME